MNRYYALLLLRAAPSFTTALLIAPIAIGLAWTVMPAFGILPAIGGSRLTDDAWRALLETPGFVTALRLTVVTGIATTILAVALAAGLCALGATSNRYRQFERWLNPLLASPHSAVALGFAFLIAPSGWLMRLISPWATGFDRPPTDIVTLQDPYGLSFIVGLLLKEVPYLTLMIIAASSQVSVRSLMASARALGQIGSVAWLKVVFPQIYPQIRLPIFAVLAFSLSAVDVGIILAPGTPPPLAVLATSWFVGYDLQLYFQAAAAATLQLAIAGMAICLWTAFERPVAALGRCWIGSGSRDYPLHLALSGLAGTAALLGTLGLFSILGMAIWSVAESWLFPEAFPAAFTLHNWSAQAAMVRTTLETTVAVGALTVALALLLTLACLENEQQRRLRPGVSALWLIYLPLLVPQIAFLFGVQVVLIRLNLDGTLLAVTWSHLLFVLPYVFLSLADPYRALDPRYAASAAALGASPWRIFLTIKMPLLARPVLAAFAVGFAVSVGQYLPTLFAGAGRIATLTTEAVTLASGGDRRTIGLFAVLQAALPFVVYVAALGLPRVLFSSRRELAR